MRVELTTAAANVVSYTFSLPGGDALVVFWSDVKASDNNQGMSAILTIPGLIATSVSGIDVMNGFEQSLIYTTESESLIIRNLLIKDYPILILLKGTQ